MLWVPAAVLLAPPPLSSRHDCERTWWSGFGIASRNSGTAAELEAWIVRVQTKTRRVARTWERWL